LLPVWPDRQRSASPQRASDTGDAPSAGTPRLSADRTAGDPGGDDRESSRRRPGSGGEAHMAMAEPEVIIALPDAQWGIAEEGADGLKMCGSGGGVDIDAPPGAPSDVSTSASASPLRGAAGSSATLHGAESPASSSNLGADGAEAKAPVPAAPVPIVVEDPILAERTRQLEESARRMRENAERVRANNRRSRLFDRSPAALSPSDDLRLPDDGHGCVGEAIAEGGASPSSEPRPRTRPHSARDDRRLQDMRRKIAELDAINELERKRLDEDQREAEERQRAQEEFERRVQEETERELRELRERGERETQERAARDEAARRDLEYRTRRRQEQQREEEERSRNLEERRREGRSEHAQMKWQAFEEELERQWAAQETDERKRIEQYARERRRQYEEFDRKLVCERQRYNLEAEFRAAARHQQARNAASADEAFYRPRRVPPPPGAPGASAPPPAAGEPRPPPFSTKRTPPPQAVGGVVKPPMLVMSPDECAILKELQSVRGASRDIQKAKVKELLFRWHPDKNPACTEKATRLFQFVQKHRDLVLGL